MKNLILLSSILILLSGCMTTVSVKNLEIKDMEVNFRFADNFPSYYSVDKKEWVYTSAAESEIVPGNTYRIQITVIDNEGNRINNPDPGDFIITSEDRSFILNRDPIYGLSLSSTLDTILFTQLQGYSIDLKVKGNPYSKTFSWPMPWGIYTTLNFSGKPGMDGSDADNSGSFGNDGSIGYAGLNGKDITILAVYYNVENLQIEGITENKMLLLIDMIDKNRILLKDGNITIDSSGGKGGNGGNAIEDGDGGSNGSGGNGGNIHILYLQDDILSQITTVTKGGVEGEPGEDGENAPFHIHFPDLSRGKPGKNGQYKKEKITKEKAFDLLSPFKDKYLEMERIITE